jgi:hypothetical protein
VSRKIETPVWLVLISTIPRSFEYPRAIGVPTALLASTNAPLLSKVSSSAVGLLGFQLEIPFTADFEANAAK